MSTTLSTPQQQSTLSTRFAVDCRRGCSMLYLTGEYNSEHPSAAITTEHPFHRRLALRVLGVVLDGRVQH